MKIIGHEKASKILKWANFEDADRDIKWENESSLPNMREETYKKIYPVSKVDKNIRLFPYVEIDGERNWLTL